MIGQKAHEFKADAYIEKKIKPIILKDFASKYTILIFYPFDFTFVCPTEILAFSTAKDKLKKIGASVIFISCDSVYNHKKWAVTEPSAGGVKGNVWPMVSDVDRCICQSYNMLNNSYVAKRGTVIIGKDGLIKYIEELDDRVGRNVDEIIRIVKNLKHLDENKDVQFCPANFEKK
ncbi:hypothetical protein COBT_003274 [Conglomerata obtusa]